MKSHADRNYTPKQFSVGERVMLSTQNLKLLNQPSEKFRSRYIGPYKILEKYLLKLTNLNYLQI